MSVLSLLTKIDPEVILHLKTDPGAFANVFNSTVMRFLKEEFERAAKFGEANQLASTGIILSALARVEQRTQKHLEDQKLDQLTVDIVWTPSGEFLVNVVFKPGVNRPAHSSTSFH